ncbi:SDR family oxidoreductase [Mucilaginibacter sp. UR6-1]|uniref:SDR family oxidoreductase n=1 Tax=Mucilaginibacter sp. UR6-1 TaxID=1435643 RepID=UPI001E488769|nr:SDR family oxidoreductase [Mucilaginibacter sp. UR6-1]MCC8407505.1 SDR family oxidoreductase [Mucilaginibacter sp. UR6-1]
MSKKVVLITGTNSGFGWLTAHSVAALGHQVYATMRDTTGKNAEKANELSQVENVKVLDVELTNDESVKKAFDSIIEAEGRIDVLVNNAGASMFGLGETATAADIQRMLDINVLGPWRTTKLALPVMREQSEGLIINVTSGFGRVSFPYFTAYCASKYALEGLSEGLHYELRPLGIDLAILEPGGFPTEMGTKVQFGADASVAGGYKVLDGLQDRMFAAIGQLFEIHKPDPQMIADAVVELIGQPKGARPLRTVIDPTTGEYIKTINAVQQVELKKAMEAYGLKELLA